MAVWFSTSLSDAVSDNRWAAEFHRPGFKFTPKVKDDWKRIWRVTEFCQYGLSLQMNEAGKGFPIYRLNEIEDCFLTDTPSKFAPISQKVANDYILNDGDVLFCRTNGNINYVGRTGLYCSRGNSVFASYLVRVRSKKLELRPEFLTAYLNTNFGRRQIVRRAMPSNQVNVSAAELKKIDILLPPIGVQDEVSAIVRNAYSAKKQGLEAYTQAQQLLESELGLDKLRFDKPVGYTAQFSELELTRRFDSEHYCPAFDNLKEKLPKHVQLASLGPLLTFCRRGKQPIYSENGLPVLNSKHILENKITLEGNRHAKPNPLASLQIQYGDVLINGTGRGTIGRTAPYLISEHQAIPDNHVTILRSPTLDPAYLSFYLNSQAGKLQVEKYQRGSSGQLELYPFDIRKFQVWDAPQSIQLEIRRLYQQATDSAKQSRQLLDQAKSRVEQLIEEAVLA